MISKVEGWLRQYVLAVLRGLDIYCNCFKKDYPWLGAILPIAVLVVINQLLPFWMFVVVSLLIGMPLATFLGVFAWFSVKSYLGRRHY